MKGYQKIIRFFGRAAIVGFLFMGSGISVAFAGGVEASEAAVPHSGENWIEKYNVRPILKGYFQWSADFTNSAQQRRTMTKWNNAFDVTRFYFGLKADLTKHIGTEWKADINAKAAAGTNDDAFDIFLKTGFVEFKNFEGVPGLKLVFGQAELPWVGYIENIWGFRVQGQVMTDYEGYLSSTDVGVGIRYELPGEWGDLHFSFVNGTGYNNGPENDNYKDFHLRVTLRPLSDKNFFLSGLSVIGFTGAKSNEHYRFGGLVGYKDKTHGVVAGEVFLASDPAANLVGRHPSLAPLRVPGLFRNAEALAFSAFGEMKFFWWDAPWNRFSVISRFDYLDPDQGIADNYHYHGIHGLAYTLNEHYKFLINHDWTDYRPGAGQQGNQTLFVQMEAKI